MNYRILSLDGGGTWSLIQVKALINIYGQNTAGTAVLQDFDMVSANSGGSIVLGALLEDLKLGEILSMFEDERLRRKIFSKTDSFGDRILHDLTGLGPKYSEENKLPALEDVLPSKGAVPLPRAVAGLRRPGAASDLSLLIVAFDYDRNRATFFRSSASSTKQWGTGEAADDVTLAEAIHASTNAPVNYFDAPARFPDHPGRYWDGAITGCNNPVLAGVTEAITRQHTPADVVVLSLGTATVALPWPQPGQPPSRLTQRMTDSNLVNDLKKLALSILDDPPDVATFLAHVMTGGSAGLNKPPADSRVVRMNPLISPVQQNGVWVAPGSMTTSQFLFLARLDMDALEQSQVDAISGFAELWLQDIARNQPIRMNGDTLDPELGQATFSAALAAWNAVK